jgi:hypothetical protein
MNSDSSLQNITKIFQTTMIYTYTYILKIITKLENVFLSTYNLTEG